jgi:hypothetical protein
LVIGLVFLTAVTFLRVDALARVFLRFGLIFPVAFFASPSQPPKPLGCTFVLVTERQSPLRNAAVDNPFSLGNDFVSAALFEIGGAVR